MKLMTTLATAIALVAGVAAADPAEGIWQTEVDDGAFAHIKMETCGAAICGTIARTFQDGGTEFQSENIGKQIVINMTPAGDGTYTGEVFRPSNGKTYVGKMTVSGNGLILKGCVAGGLICASQGWARIQ